MIPTAPESGDGVWYVCACVLGKGKRGEGVLCTYVVFKMCHINHNTPCTIQCDVTFEPFAVWVIMVVVATVIVLVEAIVVAKGLVRAGPDVNFVVHLLVINVVFVDPLPDVVITVLSDLDTDAMTRVVKGLLITIMIGVDVTMLNDAGVIVVSTVVILSKLTVPVLYSVVDVSMDAVAAVVLGGMLDFRVVLVDVSLDILAPLTPAPVDELRR